MQILKMPEARKELSLSRDVTLVDELLARLNAEGVRYCHWKSNWKIDRWLDGDGDLDLLVRRGDIEKFTAILSGLRFKKAIPPAEKDHPGIVNFYGLDEMTGKLVHVHAHYRLIMGHDLSKNYHLPVEEVFFDSAKKYKNIFIPSPELELIVFVIRMLLKHSMAESFIRAIMGKSKKHIAGINAEIDHLSAKVDRAKLAYLLKHSFPMMADGLFETCISSLQPKASAWERYAAHHRLARSLAGYARTSRTSEAGLRLQRNVYALFKKLIGINQRKKLENGGSLLAIVGGDGAGKTTCVEAVYGWLSKKFDVKKIHMGKPGKSYSTQLVAAALKLSRLFNALPGSRDKKGTKGFLQQLRWLCTARDRYKTYKMIRRIAANGGIVICDRYPVPKLNLMDGPRIADKAGREHFPLLAKIERWYYRQMLSPDALFVLRLDPKIAVARKTDEPEVHVFPRSSELWNFNWRNTGAEVIDASQPLEDVVGELRRRIWKIL